MAQIDGTARGYCKIRISAYVRLMIRYSWNAAHLAPLECSTIRVVNIVEDMHI